MRLTNNIAGDRVLRDLQSAYARQVATQREVSSGRRVHTASDDPLAAREGLRARTDLGAVDSHRKGVGSATAWLTATDTALGRIGDVLHRARELTVQASNGTLTTKDRELIAAEIDQLVASAKDAAATRVDGVHTMSGLATTTAPYAAGSDVYAGDTATGNVTREVGPGVSVVVGVKASTILGSGQTANDGLVLDTLRDLAAHLRTGTHADLQTDLQAIDRNLELVLETRATVGATQNRVDSAAGRLDQIEELAVGRLDDLEGVDLAEAISTLTRQQTAYEAALRTGANIIQPSLLDFLR